MNSPSEVELAIERLTEIGKNWNSEHARRLQVLQSFSTDLNRHRKHGTPAPALTAELALLIDQPAKGLTQ